MLNFVSIVLVLIVNSVTVYGTFNISLPSLDNLPFFGTSSTTVRPIVIINQPGPPNHYQNHHHHHNHNQNYNNGGFYLVLERTEVPYVNNNFLNNVQFQIQRINSTVAACVGTFNLRQPVQGATLVVRLYSCQSHENCNAQYLSEVPRRPLCVYLIGYQQYQQYGGTSSYLQGRSSCSAPPYQQQQHGCSLPEGTYQFVNYVPLNIVPQQIPGQRWRMDCYMAVGGRRIATFSLYARCGSTNDNFISGSSTNTQPLIITNGLQVAQFERLTATAVNSIEDNNDTEVTTIIPEAFSVSK